jgi:hypothetical protein
MGTMALFQDADIISGAEAERMIYRKNRRETRVEERITPCQFCAYPISERHHALPVSMYGENECTLQLCANCHGLYHIVQSVFVRKSKRAIKLLDAFRDAYGDDDIRLQKAYHFIAAGANIITGGDAT